MYDHPYQTSFPSLQPKKEEGREAGRRESWTGDLALFSSYTGLLFLLFIARKAITEPAERS
jgi:hypothetical protein